MVTGLQEVTAPGQEIVWHITPMVRTSTNGNWATASAQEDHVICLKATKLNGPCGEIFSRRIEYSTIEKNSLVALQNHSQHKVHLLGVSDAHFIH